MAATGGEQVIAIARDLFKQGPESLSSTVVVPVRR